MFRLLDRISSETNEPSLYLSAISRSTAAAASAALGPQCGFVPAAAWYRQGNLDPFLDSIRYRTDRRLECGLLGGVWSGNFAVMIDTPATLVRHHVVNCASHVASRSQ